jgi:hypothetical protein
LKPKVFESLMASDSEFRQLMEKLRPKGGDASVFEALLPSSPKRAAFQRHSQRFGAYA